MILLSHAPQPFMAKRMEQYRIPRTEIFFLKTFFGFEFFPSSTGGKQTGGGPPNNTYSRKPQGREGKERPAFTTLLQWLNCRRHQHH